MTGREFETKAKRTREIVTIALFCVGLWAPIGAKLVDFDPWRERLLENRVLAGPVSVRDLGTFPRRFDAYYSDRFGLRGSLVWAQSWVSYRFLGESSHERVVAGNDDWLFLASDGSIDLYRRLKPLTPSLLRQNQRALEERTEWLARRGISFVFAVVPEKATIYGEHMPPRFNRLPGMSRLDQLVAALSSTRVPFVDLRLPLHDAKSKELAYDPTGSHWNELGAFAAYTALLAKAAEVRPELTPFKATETRWSLRPGGDLARMLGLAADLNVRTPTVSLAFNTPLAVSWRQDGYGLDSHRLGRRQRRPNGGSDLTAVVFHDSFGEGLYHFVTPHFAQVSYHWSLTHFWADAVDAVRPDVVFAVAAERGVLGRPLKNPVVVRRVPSAEEIAQHRSASLPSLRGGAVGESLRLVAGRFELHDEDAELITTWASLETQTLKSWVRLSLLDTRGRATHTQEFELDDGRVAVEKSRVWEDFQLVPRAALRDATSAVIRVFEGSTLRAAWAVNEAELRKGR